MHTVTYNVKRCRCSNPNAHCSFPFFCKFGNSCYYRFTLKAWEKQFSEWSSRESPIKEISVGVPNPLLCMAYAKDMAEMEFSFYTVQKQENWTRPPGDRISRIEFKNLYNLNYKKWKFLFDRVRLAANPITQVGFLWNFNI